VGRLERRREVVEAWRASGMPLATFARTIITSKLRIEYRPTQEPRGVKRFFVQDPFGKRVNILTHEPGDARSDVPARKTSAPHHPQRRGGFETASACLGRFGPPRANEHAPRR
jgi:hypothetical protein